MKISLLFILINCALSILPMSSDRICTFKLRLTFFVSKVLILRTYLEKHAAFVYYLPQAKNVWLVKDGKLWVWKIYYIVFSYRLSGRSKAIIWLIKFLQTTDARTRMSSICIVKNQRGQGWSWWKINWSLHL